MFHFDRRLLQHFDWALLLTLLTVIGISLMNLYSASHVGYYGTPPYIKQIFYYLVGCGMMLAIISVDYRFLLRANYLIYGSIVVLLLVAMFFGKTAMGAQRWINLGIIKLQPSELAKLSMVITMASYYCRKDTGKGFDLWELLPPTGLVLLPVILIIKQPDLGTALMLLFVFASMTLFAKIRLRTFIFLAVLILALAPLGWEHGLKPYQRQRIETLFAPEADPLGAGYHIMQSKIAIGSGQTFGKGYLAGTQVHLDFLPERHTDFAFSVLAEEWGFAGAIFFLAWYFFLVFLGINVAGAARDKFGVFLAFGVTALLFWQAFVNLAMVLGLLPVVGMPLPLFSYGGSSLLTNLAGIGILLNVRMRRFSRPGGAASKA
ncbi:MAG: rod shape-determining protein RodA [Desulfobulbaceae bacterium]|nr:rod shape-determining protein RodA [Desulfobulbaceae bacterium]